MHNSIPDYTEFLDTLFLKLENTGFNVNGLQLDHIAYYTETKQEYDNLKPEFEKLGLFDHEAIISNRRVGVIKLHEPFMYRDYIIDAAELIEPKEGEVHPSGWEHAEFVISEDYYKFMEKHSGLTWDTGSIDRENYSHITVAFDKNLKVKFHDKSILQCIEIERSSK